MSDIWDCLEEALDRKEELSIEEELHIVEHNVASLQTRVVEMESKLDKIFEWIEEVSKDE